MNKRKFDILLEGGAKASLTLTGIQRHRVNLGCIEFLDEAGNVLATLSFPENIERVEPGDEFSERRSDLMFERNITLDL